MVLWASQSGAGPLVQLRTVFGDMHFELLENERPETVRNFVRYVETGRYENTLIHRLIPDWVAQFGGYYVEDRGRQSARYATVPVFPPIANETSIGSTSNILGTLALGRISTAPQLLDSELFLNLGNQLSGFLQTNQGGYPVFARMVSGGDVIETLNGFTADSPTNRLISIWDAVLPRYLFGVAEFPVLEFSENPQDQYDNVIYVDVTLLEVSVAITTEGRAVIGWQSVSDRLHHVEYTEVFPPEWQILTQRLGTGERMEVEDPLGTGRRFYRVRAIFDPEE
jgi:cyclophilin family peptidyl-prolyl cis-trans isomerase